jgi:hypothetical protein
MNVWSRPALLPEAFDATTRKWYLVPIFSPATLTAPEWNSESETAVEACSGQDGCAMHEQVGPSLPQHAI